jgi:hypothetical protein
MAEKSCRGKKLAIESEKDHIQTSNNDRRLSADFPVLLHFVQGEGAYPAGRPRSMLGTDVKSSG